MASESGGLLTAMDDGALDGRPAITIGDASITGDRLRGAASALAGRLTGARAVAVDAAPGVRTAVAILACLYAGVPAVPVPTDAGTTERRHILADSGAELWIGTHREDVVLPTAAVDLAARATTATPESADETAALIMYTSGTTGVPKGVLVSRRAIAACIDSLAAAWDWSPDDTLVHGLPLFHVHGLVLGLLGPLRIGSPLVHTVRPAPDRYAAAGGSVYFGVPTVWSRVCADPTSARALRGARLLVSGSAPLPTSVFRELQELTGHAPVERYGMTETLITVSTRSDGERRAGWVGLPLNGIRTRLVSETGDPVPHDGATLGGLEISGPTLFDGYLGRPEATAESLTTDGWFRTGDIAVIDSDGFHRIVGRQSVDLIKSGGYRIGAGEVEQALLDHPAIKEAAVIGVPDPDLGQRIIAYIVGDDVNAQSVIDFVAGSLSVHKRPREVRRVDELPRNAMGKVQKKVLAERFDPVD